MLIEKFNIESRRPPCILLAALDWGLGHATRCIPIIRFFTLNGCKVIIASEGKQKTLLQLEFPQLEFVNLRGYHFKYSNNRWRTIVKIITQIPGLFSSAIHEHKWLRDFASTQRIDAVISDNRYGFYLPGVRSVFITHQLAIQTPLGISGNALVKWLNYRAIRRFDSCWVPDLARDDNFGGELSHPHGLPPFRVDYIGPLMRFQLPEIIAEPELLLVIISGPEPQRSIFEAIILTQSRLISRPVIVIRGKPGGDEQAGQSSAGPAPHNSWPSNVTVYNHLPGEELAVMVARAGLIISRPGYTTVMEMLSARKRCLFIPTPGQTEQEYLAGYLSGKNCCISSTQNDFSIIDMIDQAQKLAWQFPSVETGLFENVLGSFIKKLKADISR